MLNGMHERGMNKDKNIKVKIRKYPGASSTDILDHIKLSLRKAPEQIIILVGTNDISNNTNYLKNVKKDCETGKRNLQRYQTWLLLSDLSHRC